MKAKRLALLAATGMTVLASSMAFAAGTSSGTDVGTRTTVTPPAGPVSGDTGGTTSGTTDAGSRSGTNPSSIQMSPQGASNTNGMASPDRETGLPRAEERSATQSDRGGVQPGQDESQGRSSTKSHQKKRTQKPGTSPTSPGTTSTSPDGSGK